MLNLERTFILLSASGKFNLKAAEKVKASNSYVNFKRKMV